MSKPIKILIVDDDPFMGEVYESLISEGHDVEVEYAASGYEALQYLKEEEVHLVVTDYYMPNGDGGTLCHFCHDQDIPCVVVSSHGPEELLPYLPKDTVILHKPRIAKSRMLEDIVEKAIQARQA
ncbi:MAG: response regulator [Oligoflexus sp.]